MSLSYKDFSYVDTAIGGAHKRNNIVDLTSIDINVDTVDAYSSMFRFKKEYVTIVEKTGTVRGASEFECWSDFIWFDIDASDLSAALLDAQTLIRGLKSMNVLNHTLIFFSGSKGFHIGINSSVFGFVPSKTLPEEMRKVCQQIASLFNIEIDTKIYNHNRLWRLPGTVHGKTNLRKTALAVATFLDLTVDDLPVLAAFDKRPADKPAYCTGTVKKVIDSLTTLRESVNTGAVARVATWIAPPLSDYRLKVSKAGLDYLLAHGVQKGSRDNEALLRSSECRKIGYDESETYELVSEWNTLNKPPLSDADIQRIVSSAFVGPGYDFGTNYESLRVARLHGTKALTAIDVNKLLNGDNAVEDEEEFVRRPMTLTECLASDGMDAPETVGKWLSWRQRITVLVGREKSGKSTLMTFEALACLQKGYKVLWVSPDEPRADIVYRLFKAGAVDYADQILIAGDSMVPASWEELAQFMADVKPDLVILDSVNSLFTALDGKGKVPDSSEAAEWQRLMNLLRPVAVALNTAIVWLHHARKDTGLYAGSYGVAAAADAVVTLKETKRENKRNLIFSGRRVNSSNNCAVEYVDEEKGFLTIEFDKMSELNDGSPDRKEKDIEFLVRYFAEHPGPADSKNIKTAYTEEFGRAPRDLQDRAKELKIKIDRQSNGTTLWTFDKTPDVDDFIDKKGKSSE